MMNKNLIQQQLNKCSVVLRDVVDHLDAMKNNEVKFDTLSREDYIDCMIDDISYVNLKMSAIDTHHIGDNNIYKVENGLADIRPRLVTPFVEFNNHYCGLCKTKSVYNWNGERNNYCSNCGAELDWGDVDER